MMEVSTKAVEKIPSEWSQQKSQHSAISTNKVSIHTDDELGRKKEVNSMRSKLYVLRLSNHLSLPQI